MLGIVKYGYNAVDFVAPPSQLDQHVVLSRPTVRGDVNTAIGSGLIVSSLVTASCFYVVRSFELEEHHVPVGFDCRVVSYV